MGSSVYVIRLQSGRYVGQLLHGVRGHVPRERAGRFTRWADAFAVAAPHRQFGAQVVEIERH